MGVKELEMEAAVAAENVAREVQRVDIVVVEKVEMAVLRAVVTEVDDSEVRCCVGMYLHLVESTIGSLRLS